MHVSQSPSLCTLLSKQFIPIYPIYRVNFSPFGSHKNNNYCTLIGILLLLDPIVTSITPHTGGVNGQVRLTVYGRGRITFAI